MRKYFALCLVIFLFSCEQPIEEEKCNCIRFKLNGQYYQIPKQSSALDYFNSGNWLNLRLYFGSESATNYNYFNLSMYYFTSGSTYSVEAIGSIPLYPPEKYVLFKSDNAFDEFNGGYMDLYLIENSPNSLNMTFSAEANFVDSIYGINDTTGVYELDTIINSKYKFEDGKVHF